MEEQLATLKQELEESRAKFEELAIELDKEMLKRSGIRDNYKKAEELLELANQGIAVATPVADALKDEYAFINNTPAMRNLYFKKGTNDPLIEGDILKNTDLAATYDKLSKNGADYFYKGDLADKIEKEVNKTGGILTKKDLENYKVRWSSPVTREFKDGRKMFSLRPPASGPVLAYILGIVDEINRNSDGALDEDALNYHRFVEALKFAYAKRALLGDEQFEDSVKRVRDELLSKEAAKKARDKIDDSKTHADLSFYGFENANQKESGTSHSCYWDKDNNVVALTSTVNYYFGSQVIPEGSGFVLNDQMDDFSTPNLTNAYGIRPSPVNFIKPGKIPQSSMVPTIIVDRDGNPEMCVGGSGGSRITTGVGLVAMRTLWQGKTIKEAIDMPRVHHQLQPTYLEVEEFFPEEYVSQLKKKGHTIKIQKIMPNVITGIVKQGGRLYANTDTRKGSTVDGE
ncbi:hypothetical protein MTO96_026055 [Rhipicephalus appendiculatus]